MSIHWIYLQSIYNVCSEKTKKLLYYKPKIIPLNQPPIIRNKSVLIIENKSTLEIKKKKKKSLHQTPSQVVD